MTLIQNVQPTSVINAPLGKLSVTHVMLSSRQPCPLACPLYAAQRHFIFNWDTAILLELKQNKLSFKVVLYHKQQIHF